MSLYEKHREQFDALAAQGKPHIAEMARLFEHAHEMDTALGVRGVVGKWATGRNGATQMSETLARLWLDKHAPRAAQESAPPAKAPGAMLLIVCPDGVSQKVERIATMLGCEVTEV